MFADNKLLGQFDLVGLPPAPRGVPQIEVTFDIDSNGIVSVGAKDMGTGKEQNIKITGAGNLSKEEIDKMKADAEANAVEDEKKKSKIEADNNAESMIFQTKKMLEEFKDKIDASTKRKIEAGIKDLEGVKATGEPDAINAKVEELSKIVQEIGAQVYQGAAAAEQAKAEGKDEKVVDAEFEEKKEETKEEPKEEKKE